MLGELRRQWTNDKPAVVHCLLDRSQTISACLDFREFMILGLFTKSRIPELSLSMIGRAHNNDFLRDS